MTLHEQLRALVEAAKRADWTQVVLNGGPPCFHLERLEGRFCLRAERWLGHGGDDRIHDHPFVPLEALLASAPVEEGEHFTERDYCPACQRHYLRAEEVAAILSRYPQGGFRGRLSAALRPLPASPEERA